MDSKRKNYHKFRKFLFSINLYLFLIPKNGKVKSFMPAGVASLVKASPSALIVPLAISGNYELMKKGYFPLTFGVQLRYTVFDAIDPKGKDINELVLQIEEMIRKEVEK